MKKIISFVILVFFIVTLSGANILQILFFSNSVLKPKKNVVIFFNSKGASSSIGNYVKAAKSSLKLNIMLVDIEKITDIPRFSTSYISKADYIVILSDKTTFNDLGKKYIFKKAISKKIPVITDKLSDITKGAFITMEGKSKNISTKLSSLLNIKIPEEVKSKEGVSLK